VSIGTTFLVLGQFARKETVMGCVTPEAGLSAVYAPRGGVSRADRGGVFRNGGF
jgi:hypothetical protein